jgi:hypothetical protein
VTVTASGGTSAQTAADQFTYQAPPPAPDVTGISPTSGPAAGGTVVTVSGSNLSGGAVAFGTLPATQASCAASTCTATSPAGSGTVDVTVTTSAGTSPTGTVDQFTYQAPPPPPPGNLVPNPGFESSGVPQDYWGGKLARSSAVVHSGGFALAQTASASSGGWDLDADGQWYAPIAAGKSYTASVWVYVTRAVKVRFYIDLLGSGGHYLDTVGGGSAVTLSAGSWTRLSNSAVRATGSGDVWAVVEPNFSAATSGTVMYWDDMGLTAN